MYATRKNQTAPNSSNKNNANTNRTRNEILNDLSDTEENDTEFNDSYTSPMFNENFETFIKDVKRRQQEKTLSVVGSILDVPLPSETDAFSEYSTFVNNIFNKALEK